MSETGCAAIVLAAGASTRLGQPKQLIRFNNESLLHRTIRLVSEAGCSPVVVVLGFEAEHIRLEVSDLKVQTVVNPEWSLGMSTSLRCGIETIERHPVPEWVLLLVSDQPRLSLDVLQALLRKNKVDNSPITASRYAGKLGVPAIFHKHLYPALKSIEGDKGARQIIEQNRSQASWVDFPGGEIDIDTPDDLILLS